MDALLPPSSLLSASTHSPSPLTPSLPPLLLFSSSWCPDCKPFLARLLTVLEDLHDASPSDKAVNVVYVSSDKDSAQCGEYVKAMPEYFHYVSFEDEEARSALKRRFRTCAGSEADSVGVEDRLRGIPNLVVLGEGGEVKTEDATKDVEGFRGEWPEGW